jgi:hypothetical protein
MSWTLRLFLASSPPSSWRRRRWAPPRAQYGGDHDLLLSQRVVDVPGLERWLRKVEALAELA